MSETALMEPRVDIAERMLRRIDMSNVSERQFVNLVRDCGFPYAQVGSGMSFREHVAYLVGLHGEFQTRFLLLEVGGEEVLYGEEDPACVEFQVRLTNALQEQGRNTGIDPAALLQPGVNDAAFGPVRSMCAQLSVQIHPWVTPEGELLLQWRRDGRDYVAMIFPAEDWSGICLRLETTDGRQETAFSTAVLIAFAKYGTWVS